MTDGFDRGKAFRLFEQALGLDESARAEFIRDRCGGDASLHAELEALLEAATADSGLTGVLFNSTARPIENLIGEQFGRFRLVEFIGEGGMGVVYRAERRTASSKPWRSSSSATNSPVGARSVSGAKPNCWPGSNIPPSRA